MAGLAEALASAGTEVVYAAEQVMSVERAALGWSPPSLRRAEVRLFSAADIPRLVQGTAADTVHICQGLRGNGSISLVQRELAASNRRQWIIMETVDADGWRGWVKRAEYRRRFARANRYFEGLLAIGHKTPGWVAARGVSASKVFPFAYFLPRTSTELTPTERGAFRFGFVGRLIDLKRVGLLIEALSNIGDKAATLVVIGDGPLREDLKRYADRVLPGRVQWVGQMAAADVAQAMKQLDCLVLPSRHDGWGAVISEALISGTPVVCSDACGAADAVKASGTGGVFAARDAKALAPLLECMTQRGRISPSERAWLANWAQSLSAPAGAAYLLNILEHIKGGAPRPAPPWESAQTAIAQEECACS